MTARLLWIKQILAVGVVFDATLAWIDNYGNVKVQ